MLKQSIIGGQDILNFDEHGMEPTPRMAPSKQEPVAVLEVPIDVEQADTASASFPTPKQAPRIPDSIKSQQKRKQRIPRYQLHQDDFYSRFLPLHNPYQPVDYHEIAEQVDIQHQRKVDLVHAIEKEKLLIAQLNQQICGGNGNSTGSSSNNIKSKSNQNMKAIPLGISNSSVVFINLASVIAGALITKIILGVK